MALSPDWGFTPAPRREADPGRDRGRLRARPRQPGRHPDPADRLAQLPRGRPRHAQLASVLRIAASACSNYDGDASNQVIWFTDLEQFDQTPMAFEVIEEWMGNIKASPWKSVAGNKPDGGRRQLLRPERRPDLRG